MFFKVVPFLPRSDLFKNRYGQARCEYGIAIVEMPSSTADAGGRQYAGRIRRVPARTLTDMLFRIMAKAT